MIDLNWSPCERRHTVLIVDDARLMRHLLAHFVESIGYSAVHAENGLVAWQILSRDAPDLIITDLEMPVVSGMQLIHQVRNSTDRRIRPIPIFVCSSITSQMQITNPLVHIDHVLDKPINLNTLRECLLSLRDR